VTEPEERPDEPRERAENVEEPAGPGRDDPAAEARRRRRQRRVAEVFGDVLPDTTSDERDPSGPSNRDEEYRRDVPPHHG
jgi:hypothetical protein